MQIITFFLILILWISSEGVTTTLTMESKRVTALVLARGGSKGIPFKNLAEVGGMSLLGRTITVAKEVNVFDEVWVSTDHEKIAKEASKYHAKVFDRSPEFAQDNSSSMSAVQEFIRSNPYVQHLALLQCTSPFLKSKYLTKMMELLKTKDCVFSVTKTFKLRWRWDGDNLKPINFNITHRPRRQDWDGELIETGMFYLASRKLLEQGLFQNENCGVVEIDPIDSIEIDNPIDLLVADAILEGKTNENC